MAVPLSVASSGSMRPPRVLRGRRALALAFAAASSWALAAAERVAAADGDAAASAAPKVHASATLLDQEVTELEDFIKICESRMDLLRDLKDTLDAGYGLPLPDAHVRALTEKMPLMAAVATDEDKRPAGSADDYLITKRVIPQAAAIAAIGFLPCRNPRTQSTPATAQQISMPSALLVAVQTDGAARIFTPSGELVHGFHTGHEVGVKYLAMLPAPHDEYMMATGDVAGNIRVHKVNMRQKKLNKEQKMKRGESLDGKISQYLGSQVNVTSQFHQSMKVPETSGGEPATLTALAITMQRQQSGKNTFVVAGDAEGRISVFTRNGTLRASVDALVNPGGIEGLHAQHDQLLYRSATEFGSLGLERLEAQRLDCPVEGRVTSAVLDPQHTHRLLVADAEGSVWVLNLKDRRNCKVDHRFPPGLARSPVDLHAVWGFALGLEKDGFGLDYSSMFALNMSHVGKRKDLLRQAPSPLVWRKGLAAAKDWAVFRRQQQGDLIALLSEDGLTIEIQELLMQTYSPSVETDFGNYKMLVIALAVVLVLGYQYMKNKGKMGGGDSGQGSVEKDFAKGIEKLRQQKKLAKGKGKGGDFDMGIGKDSGDFDGLGAFDQKD